MGITEIDDLKPPPEEPKEPPSEPEDSTLTAFRERLRPALTILRSLCGGTWEIR